MAPRSRVNKASKLASNSFEQRGQLFRAAVHMKHVSPNTVYHRVSISFGLVNLCSVLLARLVLSLCSTDLRLFVATDAHALTIGQRSSGEHARGPLSSVGKATFGTQMTQS